MNNVYLIGSNSIHLIDEEIKKIVKDNPYTTFDLNNVLLDDILEEASYFSLFDDVKYMVVKNANVFGANKKSSSEEGSFSKKDNRLVKYLDAVNPNTILIFTINGKVDTKKKIVKIIKERYKLIEIPDLKPKEMFVKVCDLLKKEGYTIDSDTLYYIINNSLNNYDLIMNELDKIKLYYQDKKDIKYDDVVNIVSRNLEDNNFKFIETIMNRKTKDALRIFDDLMLQKEEPLILISMLAKEIRNTLLVKMLMSKGRPEMMRVLGFSYDFQLDKVIGYAKSFAKDDLEGYLLLISDFDYKIKRGKINSKLALQLIIMQMGREQK